MKYTVSYQTVTYTTHSAVVEADSTDDARKKADLLDNEDFTSVSEEDEVVDDFNYQVDPIYD